MNEQDDQFSDRQFDEPLSFVDRLGMNPAVFAVLVLAGIFVLYQVIGGLISFFIMGGQIKLDRNNVGMMRGATMGAQLLFIFVPTWIAAKLLARSPSVIFPFHPPTVSESVFSVIALIALQRVMDTYVYFENMIPLPEFLTKLLAPFKELMETTMKTMVKADAIPELLFVLLVVAVVPAFVEECLFRGFVIASFAKKWEPMRAALFAGIIFGAYHLNPFEIVPLMALGFFLGVLRISSGSLFLPVAAHFLNNFMAVMGMYWKLDEMKALNPTEVTRGAVVSMAIQAFVFAVIFLAAMRAYLRAAHIHRIERGET